MNMNLIRALSPIKRPVLCKILSSNYSLHNSSRYTETENRWRATDNVSQRYRLIYKAPMEQMLNYSTAYLTFSTATVGCLGLYYATFIFDKAGMNDPVILGDSVVIANSGAECLAYLGAFFLFHAAVKLLLSKYVLRLYKDGDNYIAVFRGHFYNTTKKHKFHIKDAHKINSVIAVAWSNARFSLGNKKAILLEDYFKTPEYYNNLVYKDNKSKEDE